MIIKVQQVAHKTYTQTLDSEAITGFVYVTTHLTKLRWVVLPHGIKQTGQVAPDAVHSHPSTSQINSQYLHGHVILHTHIECGLY